MQSAIPPRLARANHRAIITNHTSQEVEDPFDRELLKVIHDMRSLTAIGPRWFSADVLASVAKCYCLGTLGRGLRTAKPCGAYVVQFHLVIGDRVEVRRRGCSWIRQLMQSEPMPIC